MVTFQVAVSIVDGGQLEAVSSDKVSSLTAIGETVGVVMVSTVLDVGSKITGYLPSSSATATTKSVLGMSETERLPSEDALVHWSSVGVLPVTSQAEPSAKFTATLGLSVVDGKPEPVTVI
jgi:hypothetical protein